MLTYPVVVPQLVSAFSAAGCVYQTASLQGAVTGA
jgi:hypothetical protein